MAWRRFNKLVPKVRIDILFRLPMLPSNRFIFATGGTELGELVNKAAWSSFWRLHQRRT